MRVFEINRGKMAEYMSAMDVFLQTEDKSIVDLINHALEQVETVSHPTEYALAFMGIRDGMLGAAVHGGFNAEEFATLAGGTANQTLNIIALAYVAEVKKQATQN